MICFHVLYLHTKKKYRPYQYVNLIKQIYLIIYCAKLMDDVARYIPVYHKQVHGQYVDVCLSHLTSATETSGAKRGCVCKWYSTIDVYKEKIRYVMHT
jgi:hypothetical protein